MDNSKRLFISLRITDFSCPPSDIADALQLSPTDGWDIGGKSKNSNRVRKNNGWIFQKSFESLEDMSSKITEFIKEFYDKIDGIKKIGSHKSQLYIALYLSGEVNCGISLSPHTIDRMSELGFGLDVDIYQL